MENDLRLTYDDTKKVTESGKLAATLDVIASYTPAFVFLISLGLGVIYIIAANGFPNQEPPWQLLWLAGAAALVGFIYIPVPWVIKRGNLLLAETMMLFSYTGFIIAVALFLTSRSSILYFLVWAYPLILILLSEKRRQWIVPLLSGFFGTIGIYFSQSKVIFDRLPAESLTTTFANIYLAFIILSWMGLIIIVRVIQFKTLTARLTTSFLLLVLIPAAVTTLVAAFQSYTRDMNNVYLILDSTTLVKEQQINQIINGMFQDLDFTLRDPIANQRFEFLFESEPNSSLSKINNAILLGYLKSIIGQTNNKYEEVLLMDPGGNVVLSTIQENIGRNYVNNSFFHQGLLESFSTTVTDIPEFGEKAFLIAQPVKNNSGETLGVIAMRSKYDGFEQIAEQASASGIEDESYLISENLVPLSKTINQTSEVISPAALKAINDKSTGYDTYQNYSETTVLGAYRWLPGLHAAVISEVSRSKALFDTLILIATVFAVGIIAIGLTIIAVFMTARTISTPISDLAQTASQLSTGDLSSRSELSRTDEIGKLSISLNSMADRLQEFVGDLEQKITDRTKDLQRQALRLRVASEISRDSASATELKELLNRSAHLIKERFGFYHSGIFLLDDNREYALLSAASGDAGLLMLETGHKLRVGEGIVGLVAQTGESRIVRDTSIDSVYSRNSLLPATRSELSLPLKVYNRVIGVLDVQSDLHNAFLEEDVATLQIMADQLAVAIERTRVYQDSQESIRELKRSYQGYTEESWSVLSQSRDVVSGYVYEGVNVRSLTQPPVDSLQIFETGISQTTSETIGRHKISTLKVPIKIRGEVIGVIKMNFRGENIPDDTITMVEEITNRVGTALETSRLVFESRHQANRERAVSEATARIGSSTDFDEILKAATEELGKILGESEVVVQLSPLSKY
jgi:GAF domain-containing protein/HAMP domain-containing protein